MKIVTTSIVAGLVFFLFTGISFGTDLDDIDFTIRVVVSDDVGEMYNELSLPEMVFDVLDEPSEGDAGRENEVGEHENIVEARDEREDEIEDRDEVREADDERDEVHDEDDHEKEHERQGG